MERDVSMAAAEALAPSPTSQAPLTEDAFLADRQKFWSLFTGLVFWVAAFIVVILILMAIFLV
jgi:hypothetical protein